MAVRYVESVGCAGGEIEYLGEGRGFGTRRGGGVTDGVAEPIRLAWESVAVARAFPGEPGAVAFVVSSWIEYWLSGSGWGRCGCVEGRCIEGCVARRGGGGGRGGRGGGSGFWDGGRDFAGRGEAVGAEGRREWPQRSREHTESKAENAERPGQVSHLSPSSFPRNYNNAVEPLPQFCDRARPRQESVPRSGRWNRG